MFSNYYRLNSLNFWSSLLFLSIAFLGLTSCEKNDCRYEEGTVLPLNEEMMTWLGDLNASSLNFVSEDSTMLTVDVSYNERTYNVEDCEDAIFTSVRQTYYFDSVDSLVVTGGQSRFDFTAKSDSLDIDFWGALLSSDLTFGDTELVNSIVIHEKTFEEVYVMKDDVSDNITDFNYFVFKQGEGLLSFSYKGEIWLRE